RARTGRGLGRGGGGGVWDTDPATAHWALGAAGGLDGALLNSGTGTVSFGVADGGAFFVFAADPSSVFTSGVSFTLIANFADGTSASATVTVLIPTTCRMLPRTTGLKANNLTVTDTCTCLQRGAIAGCLVRVT